MENELQWEISDRNTLLQWKISDTNTLIRYLSVNAGKKYQWLSILDLDLIFIWNRYKHVFFVWKEFSETAFRMIMYWWKMIYNAWCIFSLSLFFFSFFVQNTLYWHVIKHEQCDKLFVPSWIHFFQEGVII